MKREINNLITLLKMEGVTVHYMTHWKTACVWVVLDCPTSPVAVDLDLFLEVGVNAEFYKCALLNILDPNIAWILWNTPLGKSVMRPT